jgi:hypothetical protein
VQKDESLVRPAIVCEDLERSYRQMARDKTREAEALEWVEGTVGDRPEEPVFPGHAGEVQGGHYNQTDTAG